MGYLESLNDAIDYIEKNIENHIDVNEVSKLVNCSSFHFQRIFSLIAGVSFGEYVRRRRMSLAAIDLLNKNEKVICLAYKYDYESPTAFNRAFKSVHGIAPSQAKKQGSNLKSYPPISFSLSIKGDVVMNFKIVTKESFKIIGFKKHYSSMEEGMKSIPNFWGELSRSGAISANLYSLMNGDVKGLLGVCSVQNEKGYDYYVAVSSTKKTPKGLSELVIPKSTWAIFECIGPMPSAIQELEKRIVTEWLPNSTYEYGDGADIEVYFDGDVNDKNYKCEVWLPIKKK